MLLRLLPLSVLPFLIAGQEFQCGTDKIQTDIAKTVVQFNCKDKISDINHCCIKHDGCYDRQEPRANCDNEFCTCVKSASAANPLCGFYTSIFCDTAKVFGEAAYKKAGETKAKQDAEVPTTPPTTTMNPQQRAIAAAAEAAAAQKTADEAAAAAAIDAVTQTPATPPPKSTAVTNAWGFTPFPNDPMAKLAQLLNPTTPAPRPRTPDPLEIERQRAQALSKLAFEQTLEQSRKANAKERHRERMMRQQAELMMNQIKNGRHLHPTGSPPTDLPTTPFPITPSYHQERSHHSHHSTRELTPEMEEIIERNVQKVLRGTYKERLPESQKEEIVRSIEEQIGEKSEIRRAPQTTSTPSTTPVLVKQPTNYNNLFHNVPSNSEPQPFAEVKATTPNTLETTVETVFHPKKSIDTSDASSLPLDDPTASLFHPKENLEPITEFLEDREVIDTLSSIDIGKLGESPAAQGFTEQQGPVAAGTAAAAAGPFESLLQEAQSHLRQSQARVDQLLSDQRLKLEREETLRKAILAEKRRHLAELQEQLEERKLRRDQKRRDREIRQRLLADRANESEWRRRLDQEAKVKALEDSTRQPGDKRTKKHRTTTIDPLDEDEESLEATTRKSRRPLSRHAPNELDDEDSFEAYEAFLRWRERRRLARRKHTTEDE